MNHMDEKRPEKEVAEKMAADMRDPVHAKATMKLHPKRPMSFYVRKYIMLILGAAIASIGLELFLIPNNIIDGGLVGLSIMAQAIFKQPFGLFLTLLNIPFFYIGYKQM